MQYYLFALYVAYPNKLILFIRDKL